ncbi:hypothetical protein [Nocardioides sambongensis]|nr:hypothetical protein [Nocardioides sambongensis]
MEITLLVMVLLVLAAVAAFGGLFALVYLAGRSDQRARARQEHSPAH